MADVNPTRTRFRAWLQRPDVIGGLTAMAGAVVTFFPPEGFWWKMLALAAFASFTYALICANQQQERELVEQITSSIKAETDPLHASLQDISALVAKRERDVLREGTLRQRAELLGAQMFQFLRQREYYWPMRQFRTEVEGGGEIHATLPDAEWEAETKRMFRERYLGPAKAIAAELGERGVKDRLVNVCIDDDAEHIHLMGALSWRLQEVAGWLEKPPTPDRLF